MSDNIRDLLDYVHDEELKNTLLTLAEKEEKRERWIAEKNRRREYSLDDEKLSRILEFELSKVNASKLNEIERITLAMAVSKLEDDEKLLIAYICEGMSERAIAKQFGVYHNAIHYKKKKVLEKLRNLLLD